MPYTNAFYQATPAKPFILIMAVCLGLSLYVYQSTRINVASEDFQESIIHSRSASVIPSAEQRTYVNLLIFFQAGVGLTLIVVPIAISVYRNRAMVKRLNYRNSYVEKIQQKLRTKKLFNEGNAKSFERQLLQKFPYLTAHDLKICSFLLQNYSSKEIAKELNITPGSVNTARYRLRKKMNLPKETDLIIYLNKMA